MKQKKQPKTRAQIVQDIKNGITVFTGSLAMAAQVLMPAPLAAQESAALAGQTRNNDYQAVVGQIATAHVIQIFEGIIYGGGKNDIIIYDIDGDGNTTNDQKVKFTAAGYAGQHGIKVGSIITFTESEYSVNFNTIPFESIKTVNGQNYR